MPGGRGPRPPPARDRVHWLPDVALLCVAADPGVPRSRGATPWLAPPGRVVWSGSAREGEPATSANARFSNYARKTTYYAVSRAYACLAGEERALFTELLDAVRSRTAVRMCPPVVAALQRRPFCAARPSPAACRMDGRGRRDVPGRARAGPAPAGRPRGPALSRVGLGTATRARAPTPSAAGSWPTPPGRAFAIRTCRCQ